MCSLCLYPYVNLLYLKMYYMYAVSGKMSRTAIRAFNRLNLYIFELDLNQKKRAARFHNIGNKKRQGSQFSRDISFRN